MWTLDTDNNRSWSSVCSPLDFFRNVGRRVVIYLDVNGERHHSSIGVPVI